MRLCRLRHHGHGDSCGGVRLVRHCIPRERRRIRPARSSLPVDTAIGQRHDPRGHLDRARLRPAGDSPAAAAARPQIDPRLLGIAYRAGSDPRRGAAARRRGDRHQRLQAVPQCALRGRVRAFGSGQSPAAPRRGCSDRGAAAPSGEVWLRARAGRRGSCHHVRRALYRPRHARAQQDRRRDPFRDRRAQRLAMPP